MSVIVEVTKTYEDAQLKALKECGELFWTDRIRAQQLVKAGVAKVVHEDQTPAKAESKAEKE